MAKKLQGKLKTSDFPERQIPVELKSLLTFFNFSPNKFSLELLYDEDETQTAGNALDGGIVE